MQDSKSDNSKINASESIVLLLLVASLILSSVLLFAWLNSPYNFDVDSTWYISMAEGHFENIIKPFSDRVLHPFLVGAVNGFTNIGISLSFFLIALISLIILTVTLAYIFNKYLPLYLCIPLLVVPVIINLFQDYFLPDIFYSALLALFFLSLFFNKLVWTVLITFLLTLTREWALLLVFTILLIGVIRKNWKLVICVLLPAIVGFTLLNFLIPIGNTNIHKANWIEYISGKLFYNFLKNDLGFVLWTNTLAANNPASFSKMPLIVINLPSWIKAGNIDKIGIYSIDFLYPLKTANLLLTLFGLMPTLIITDILHFRKKLFNSSLIYAQGAMIYGLLSFFIGTSVGASVGRLIAFGWPCFFIALPFIIKNFHKYDKNILMVFFLSNFVICWLSVLYLEDYIHSLLPGLIIFCLLILLHRYCYKLLTHSWKTNEKIGQSLNFI